MKRTIHIAGLFLISLIATLPSCIDAQSIKDREAHQRNSIITYVPAVSPTGLGVVHKLTNEEFQKVINDKVGVLVDVRTPKEFAQGHLFGAVNVDFKTHTFKSFISKFDTGKPILIYCGSGNRSGKAEKIMRAIGFKEVYDLKTGFGGWKSASLPISAEDNEANIALQNDLIANAPTFSLIEGVGIATDIDATAFKELIEKGGITLVDVRTKEEFLSGTIQGAVHVNWKDKHFAETVVKEISNDKPVAIFCGSGQRSGRAKTVMLYAGFSKVYNLSTGIKGWKVAHYPLATMEIEGDIRGLDVENFNNAVLSNVGVLIDVRTQKEFDDYHIPGAIIIDFKGNDFEKTVTEKLSKDTPVVIYCRSGGRSGRAMKALEKMGYKVYNLKNGILDWKKHGMPLKGDNVNVHHSGEESC